MAALVYRRDKHRIDLFIWPGRTPARARTVQGYHGLAWSRDGMVFRAVSDLNAAELGDFETLLRPPN